MIRSNPRSTLAIALSGAMALFLTQPRLRAADVATPPQIRVMVNRAKVVDKRVNAPIYVKPTTQPSTVFTDFMPPSGFPFNGVPKLFECADKPWKVIVVGDNDHDYTPLLCIDVNDPDATETRTLHVHDHSILSVADGGNVVITRPNDYSPRKLALWEYVDGVYKAKAEYTFWDGKDQLQPDQAILLSPTRLILRTGFGDVFLLDVRTGRQLAFLQCHEVTLHPSGQYLITSKNRDGLVVRASDLAIVADIPDTFGGLTIDPTGAYAAAWNGSTVTITKFGSKNPLGHLAGLGGIGFRHFLIGGTGILNGQKYYYDIKTGIPTWTYDTGRTEMLQLANGQFFCAGMTSKNQRVLCMTALPDAAGAGAIAKAKPEQFVIAAGAHIAIKGDFAMFDNPAEAKKNLEGVLAAVGHKSDPAATQYQINVTSAAGPTDKITYRIPVRLGPPEMHTVDAPSTIVTFVLTKDGKPIWTRELKYGAGFILNHKGNQSIEQDVADASHPTAGRVKSLDLPGYIVNGTETEKVATLGESDLTPQGFQPVEAH